MELDELVRYAMYSSIIEDLSRSIWIEERVTCVLTIVDRVLVAKPAQGRNKPYTLLAPDNVNPAFY